VLRFGGTPTFALSAWEWAFRAAGARSVDADAGQTGSGGWLDVHPESPSLLHELVCLAAIEGAREVALATLKRGIAIKPELRSWARKDEDYRTLHQDPNFAKLTAD
jgi:hypothetical protein